MQQKKYIGRKSKTKFSKKKTDPANGFLCAEGSAKVPEPVNKKKIVKKARLVPLLIESIKELKKEIEILKAKQH